MYGKILIRFELCIKTGLHIGGSQAFSAIGAVDSPVVRDPVTRLPIIPGSSLKGKIRTLLARSLAKDIERMPDCDNDDERILRLFGTAGNKEKGERAMLPRCSRLQFSDCMIKNLNDVASAGVTEVKTENGINRRTSIANPRQIERVIAGTIFDVRIVYDVMNEDDVEDDMRLLAKGLKLLQWDYLGGHGSRGSGRVGAYNFELTPFEANQDMDELTALFAKVSYDELFTVQATL